MSRTKRNIFYANLYARNVKHFNYLKSEVKAAQELTELGYPVSNRLKSAKSRIVTDYDDLPVAAYSETWHKKWILGKQY
jgi:hypothetical protein